MNNAKTKLFQSGIIKCKAEGRFVYRCSEFKYQSAGFPGAEPWTTLSVSMLVSLCACRNANPESLSAHIVDIGTKTVTTVKTGARLGVACLPVRSLVTSVYTVLLHFK